MAGGILERIRKIFYKKEEKKKFSGSNEYFMKNGGRLLEESISLFEGRTNPIRCLSVDELNTIDFDINHVFHDTGASSWHRGVWEGHNVLLVIYPAGRNNDRIQICLDIVISAQMGIHNNVVQLLGCCLETEYPVLVFEGAEIKGSLHDRLLGVGESQSDPPLEWKDRLRIAWEISYALAYLHTAFPRPIIHRDVKPGLVFLNKNNVAKLSDFSYCISIPKGKTHVEDRVMGTISFLAPEYIRTERITEKVDVYSFGVVLLMLLTGKQGYFFDDGHQFILVKWAREGLEEERTREMVDPAIIKGNKETISEELWLQWQQSLKLALRCVSIEEDNRPTMEEVAAQLKSIIRSSESAPSSSNTH